MVTERVANEQGGMIASWLVKLAIGLAVVSILLFDAGSIVVNFFGLDSTADSVANAVATDIVNLGKSPTQEELEALARAHSKESGARVVKVDLSPEGVVSVRLKRRANTLVVRRIGALEDWTKATADSRAGTG